MPVLLLALLGKKEVMPLFIASMICCLLALKTLLCSVSIVSLANG